MKEDEGLKKLVGLFERTYGTTADIEKISGGGSSRNYYRFKSDTRKTIGVTGEDKKENEIFLRLCQGMEKEGIRVPHIIEVHPDHDCYLIEDLGPADLYSILNAESIPGEEKIKLSRKALLGLIKLQTDCGGKLLNLTGYEPCSRRLVRWDLNYFKYDFLKPYGIDFDENRLEDDFDSLLDWLDGKNLATGFMYRDFQSRNIMVKDGELYFIDFQGARKGPLTYDAASFIWQAKAPFTFRERKELGEFYIEEMAKRGFDGKKLAQDLDGMILLRTLQVLGAYGFRGLIEGKKHFKESIPFAIKNLEYLREEGKLRKFPEIEKISAKLMEKIGEKKKEVPVNESKGLSVKVYSFSYKKGYPEDESGNGGGFMFDCRAIHNPGRYEEYKTLTGKDPEVIEFLERNDEAGNFVRKAIEIVSPSVERYIERGFTSLQVGFGCTGGRHRSVYCAERFSKELRKKFPEIEVLLIHREQTKL